MAEITTKTKLPPPKLILFDAAGTLFDVPGPVGEVYAAYARRYGVDVEATTLQARFLAAFRAQPSLAFRDFNSLAELRQREYDWWRRLVCEVFAGVTFPRFEEFFAALFDHFRHAGAWQLFDDVVPTLQTLHARGITLAVLSNFDSRLLDVLEGLGLTPFFAGVHYSAQLGAAKPDSQAFHSVVQSYGLWPDEAWHVGDSMREDYEGATQAGLKAWRISRAASPFESAPQTLKTLTELMHWLH